MKSVTFFRAVERKVRKNQGGGEKMAAIAVIKNQKAAPLIQDTQSLDCPPAVDPHITL